MKVCIDWRGRKFTVFIWISDGQIVAIADRHTLKTHDEHAAYLWLGDHGLPKRQTRRLLDAAIRGVGPFADPAHPRRL